MMCVIAVGLMGGIIFFCQDMVNLGEQMPKTDSSTILHKQTEVGIPEKGVHPEHIDVEQQQQQEQQSPKNHTVNKEAKKPLRFCTEKVIYFDKLQQLPMHYQCMGAHYDEFTQAMHLLANTLPEPMGRRDFPVASNRNVLVMGNSHTRQMINALVCQYKNEVVHYEDVVGSTSTGESWMVRFTNNSTILSLTNNAIPYSPKWPELIKTILGRPVRFFDGIVLGKFNSYEESLGTNFLATMTEALKNVPGNVDFSNTTPPTLRDVANVYQGPVVYVSMFARYGISALTQNREFINTVNNDTRHHLSTIDGRKYIDKLKMECGANRLNSTGLCYEDSDKNVSPKANGMHRCTGSKGGHPDLIAWEVAEKLNAL